MKKEKLILSIILIIVSILGYGKDFKTMENLFKKDSAHEVNNKTLLGVSICPKIEITEPSTGINIKATKKKEHPFMIEPFDYENSETVFIIEGEEVLRFFEDSIILYFKNHEIVIKEDSLCNLLKEITKETFNNY